MKGDWVLTSLYTGIRIEITIKIVSHHAQQVLRKNISPGADIHKTRYRTDVLDFNKRYRSATVHYHAYERGVPDIVLQHEKCIGHSVKVPGKCPLSDMDISPC